MLLCFVDQHNPLKLQVPFSIPGSTYAAGQKAKVKLADFILQRVREQDHGHNHGIFLHMLKSQPDSRGILFEDDEVALQLMWLTSPLVAKLVGSCVVTLLAHLEQHPAALERARSEADAAGEIDFHACADRLPFIRACIAESMRLEPPSIVAQRFTEQPVSCQTAESVAWIINFYIFAVTSFVLLARAVAPFEITMMIMTMMMMVMSGLILNPKPKPKTLQIYI
jgi:cytochrome P450